MSRLGLVLVLGLAASLSGGCGDSKPAPAAQQDNAHAADPELAGLPVKFSPFTTETVRSLEGRVKVGAPWKRSRREFDARLGLSTYHDSGAQMWAVAEGEECWSTTLTWAEGDTVKAVVPPTKFTAADGDAYKHCVAASGRNKCFRDGGHPDDCTDKFPTVGL